MAGEIMGNILLMLSKTRTIPYCILNTYPYTPFPMPPHVLHAPHALLQSKKLLSVADRDWSKCREWLTMGPLAPAGPSNTTQPQSQGTWRLREQKDYKTQGPRHQLWDSVFNVRQRSCTSQISKLWSCKQDLSNADANPSANENGGNLTGAPPFLDEKLQAINDASPGISPQVVIPKILDTQMTPNWFSGWLLTKEAMNLRGTGGGDRGGVGGRRRKEGMI